MPMYYNGGSDAIDAEAVSKAQGVDEDDRKKIKSELTKHHPFTRPHRDKLVAKDGALYIRKPGMYCNFDGDGNPVPELVPYEPGSVCFGVMGVGFFVVPPGGSVVIDPSIPESAVKDAAPHLLTEAEAMSRGLLKPPAEMKSAPSKRQ